MMQYNGYGGGGGRENMEGVGYEKILYFFQSFLKIVNKILQVQ